MPWHHSQIRSLIVNFFSRHDSKLNDYDFVLIEVNFQHIFLLATNDSDGTRHLKTFFVSLVSFGCYLLSFFVCLFFSQLSPKSELDRTGLFSRRVEEGGQRSPSR